MSSSSNSQVTLLPADASMSEHPPIFLKLNDAALELLASSFNSNEMSTNVALSICDRSASLRIGEYEFQGSHYREPGSVQVFAPDQNDAHKFHSMGFVQNRVSLKQDKPQRCETNRSVEGEIAVPESKVSDLHAIKPHSVTEITAKTQASDTVVQSATNNKVAGTTPSGKSPHKMKSQEKPEEIRNGVQDKVSDGISEEIIASKNVSKPLEKTLEKPGKDTSKLLKRRMSAETGKKDREDSSSKRSKNNEDMFELARKFKEVYDEYLDLYGKLSNPKSRPASQVQRLMAMHKQLGQWKKTLWSNARSKQVK